MNIDNSTKMGQPDEKASSSLPLACQPSIFSMTFDELQMTGGLGKDFGSMNMEDLIKNIWTVEEAEGSGVAGVFTNASGGNLHRQGSLTLPRTLGVRTVEDVWNDLSKENGGSKDGIRFSSLNQREPTLGEVTLEEFLARAGVDQQDIKPVENSSNVGVYGDCGGAINGDVNAFTFGLQPIADEIMGKNNTVSSSSSFVPNNNALMSSQQHQNQQSQPLLQPLIPKQSHMVSTTQLGNNGIMNMAGLRGLTTTTMADGSPRNPHPPFVTTNNNLDTSSISSPPCGFNQGGRGRRSNTIEKQVERRHKRMIKNRESATRSRARKQAYTLELEEEVAKLKEVNKELQKNQAELMEAQKKQILESLKRPRGAEKTSLRRTMTGPW